MEDRKAASGMSQASICHPNAEKAGGITDHKEPAPVPGHRRLKALVSAYACSPLRGGEYGIGWGWAEAISKYHDLWVLTGDEWRQEIEAELSRRPELRNRLRFYYIPRVRYLRVEKIWPPSYPFPDSTTMPPAFLSRRFRI